MDFKDVSTQAEKAIDRLPDLVSDEFAKATSRKNTDLEDVVQALLGSPIPMLQRPMTMLEHEKFLNTFSLYAKRQVQITSIQAMGNSAGPVCFDKHPTFWRSQDYEATQEPHFSFP